jgi:predicted TIM-barrel fold metal-dependent hydrolase
LNVVKAVYEEVAVRADQREAEADYAVALCRSGTTPTVAAIIGGDPGAVGFEQYITRFKGSPYVKGLRHSYARGMYANEQFIAGVRLLGELGMSFDLNLGSDLLAESAKLVAVCPRTRFVLDHCGNPNVKWFTLGREGEAAPEPSSNARRNWEAGVARLAEQNNVVCKISGVAESGEDGKVTAQVVAPAVNYCLDRFGEDRVMFASNWPVCLKTITLAAWVSILKEVVAPRGERFSRKLFYGNAAGFFGL